MRTKRVMERIRKKVESDEKVVVYNIGSTNMDETQMVRQMPESHQQKIEPEGPPILVLGGKGFNQARAQKLQNPNAKIIFASCVGDDAAGKVAKNEMDMVGSYYERNEDGAIILENDRPIRRYMPGFTEDNIGIEHEGVKTLEKTNTDGRTIFVIKKTAKNRMIGKRGACVEKVLPEIINQGDLEESDIVVAQMKMPNYETRRDESGRPIIVGDGAIKFLAEYCEAHDKMFVVDPTPLENSWLLVKENLFDKISYLTPNEDEAFALARYLEGKTPEEVAAELKTISREEMLKVVEKLVSEHPNVVATVGELGVIYNDGKKARKLPTYPTDAVDSTGAGDTFNGAFIGALTRGEELRSAIKFGLMASSMKVRYRGAQVGVPTYEETREAIREYEQEHAMDPGEE